jgi:hypothetical protein
VLEANGYGAIQSGTNTAGIFYADLITQFANTNLSARYQMNLVQKILRELSLINISGTRFT